MNDKIVSKIQKLLARGDEARNDNPHERAIAMRQAHALLAMHGLEMQDITDAAQRDHNGPIVKGECGLTTKYVWEAVVWHEVARLNGCKIVRGAGGRKVWILGRQLRADVVKSMSRYVVESIKREARAYGAAPVSFGNGAASGVHAQVSEILERIKRGEVGEQQVSTSTALVLVDQHRMALVEADAAMRAAFPRLRKGGGSRSRDGDAYGAGKAYGRTVGLNGQVGGGGSRTLRLS